MSHEAQELVEPGSAKALQSPNDRTPRPGGSDGMLSVIIFRSTREEGVKKVIAAQVDDEHFGKSS